jgi:hypothetical protein
MKKKKKNRNWLGLFGMFIYITIFISLIVITAKYEITTAFFQFDNQNGIWEQILNIGMFLMIGIFCLNNFFDELKEFRRR